MIDEYGEGIYADLRFYYQIDLVDVIEGRGPSPLLVISLLLRLPDTSMTSALAMGGRRFFGWGMDRNLLAATYDAINANTRATGNWSKGKAPKIPAWPRPDKNKSGNGEAKRPTTVADIYYSKFMRR